MSPQDKSKEKYYGETRFEDEISSPGTKTGRNVRVGLDSNFKEE